MLSPGNGSIEPADAFRTLSISFLQEAGAKDATAVFGCDSRGPSMRDGNRAAYSFPGDVRDSMPKYHLVRVCFGIRCGVVRMCSMSIKESRIDVNRVVSDSLSRAD